MLLLIFTKNTLERPNLTVEEYNQFNLFEIENTKVSLDTQDIGRGVLSTL